MSLAKHGTKLVEAKRVAFLEDALAEYQKAASTGHRRFRLKGVWEAMFGALAWTLFLIGVSIILAWNRIDIFDYYHKATGIVLGH